MIRSAPWSNWAGNVKFAPRQRVEPKNADEVADAVRRAGRAGDTVRPIGASHSSVPLAATLDMNIDLRKMSGVTDVNVAERRVSILPGTRVNAIGPALWEHGLALKNQGDIDAQQFAGAISTGTHGSGKQLQSFSGSVRGITLVDGRGDVLQVDESRPDLLAACQVGLGLTGIYTNIDLEVRNAFFIHEMIRYWSLDELWDHWDEEIESRLHFSFFWYPAQESAGIFDMRVPDGRALADTVYVKLYDELPLEAADDLESFKQEPLDRVDKPFTIYPEIPTEVFHELEYMVPFEKGKEAVAAVRDLVYRRFPNNVHPVEVRCVARDAAFLSPQYQRDSIVIAVHCDDMATGRPFLLAVSDLLKEFDARPHWGKQHYLEDEYLEHVIPGLPAFRTARREIDPDGLFLNDYLRSLFI